jgi:hypothetical protein
MGGRPQFGGGAHSHVESYASVTRVRSLEKQGSTKKGVYCSRLF